MSGVTRKRYRRDDLEKKSESEKSDSDEELYVPLKERRKLQFSELGLFLLLIMTHNL